MEQHALKIFVQLMVCYTTFKSACMALALLNDDGEWHDALNEASTWASGVHLQNMFCSMLIFF